MWHLGAGPLPSAPGRRELQNAAFPLVPNRTELLPAPPGEVALGQSQDVTDPPAHRKTPGRTNQYTVEVTWGGLGPGGAGRSGQDSWAQKSAPSRGSDRGGGRRGKGRSAKRIEPNEVDLQAVTKKQNYSVTKSQKKEPEAPAPSS